MANIDELKGRTELAIKSISQILKSTGVCLYGINKTTNTVYLADRHDVANGIAKVAIEIDIDTLNDFGVIKQNNGEK